MQVVPDLAGWKRERFLVSEDHNWISVARDWVCGILSPDTMRNDQGRRGRKGRQAEEDVFLRDLVALE